VIAPRLDPAFADQHPLRILLAEDNVVNQKVAQQILGRLGYTVDVAANGLEVLAAFRRQPYDLVLMDVQMPEMDGLEATAMLRQTLPAGQQPVIIAMTAAAQAEDRHRCLQAGMDGYIAKPVRLDELTAALRGVRSERVRGGLLRGVSGRFAEGVSVSLVFSERVSGCPFTRSPPHPLMYHRRVMMGRKTACALAPPTTTGEGSPTRIGPLTLRSPSTSTSTSQ
jgi:CheY-like chemotaxis protein